MTTTKIEQIWTEQESDQSVTEGLILRRYTGSILPSVFVAMRKPGKVRGVAISIPNNELPKFIALGQLRDINIDAIPDSRLPDKTTLFLYLTNDQHKDTFSVLCEDLMTWIGRIDNDHNLVKELLNRFEKWKSLFDKAALQGLTAEEQRGLYGELHFIRKFLDHKKNPIDILTSWVGPSMNVQDFQYSSWAVEVKTTHGNNHQKIHINNERQLDTTNLVNLFLFHTSIEVRRDNGESLNQIIDILYDKLSHDQLASNRLKAKLMECGYFRQHEHLYNSTGYFIRDETFHKVYDDFPRIEEEDIRNGVGDVKYSIIITNCGEYLRTEQDVFDLLNFE